MALQFGRNAFLNISDAGEAVYGDGGGTYNIYNRIFSCTLKKMEERVQTAKLTTTDGGFARGQFAVSTQVTGTIEVPLQYEGIGIWLKNALGSASSAGVGPYTHTYKADTTDLPSFGIKFQRGSGSMEFFKGMMISTMNISVAAGEEAKISCDMIGKNSASRSGGFPAAIYGDGAQAYHYECSTLTYNGVTYALYNFELAIDNKLETRYILGSTETASPDVNDIRDVSLSATCGMEDNVLYDAQIAGTSATATIVLTQASPGTDTITITLRNGVLMEYDDSITTAGRLERSFTIKGFSDSSNEAIEIEIVNGDSSAVAN